MERKIVKRVKSDKHTEYMACSQYVDWVFQAFDDNLGNAFIVQEIILDKEIDEIKTISHYFEAWHVINGECKKGPYQESDDLFCVGHPFDDRDALKESIGHKGRIAFIPRVFLVKEGTPLYDEIQSWPTDVVFEANGLQACYYTEELARQVNNHQEFLREPFCHEWRFDDPKLIYEVILHYCTTMYHPDNIIDRTNFYIAMEDFFSEGTYSEIKQQIIDIWNEN